MKRLLLALPILLGACSTWFLPNADQMKALAGDPNSVCINVTTPWGGANFDRNHGCGTASAPVVVVSPSPTPSHVEVIRP